MKTTLKTCRKCKRELPATAEYFWRNYRHKDGLQYRCKDCLDEQRRKRMQKVMAKRDSAEKRRRDLAKYKLGDRVEISLGILAWGIGVNDTMPPPEWQEGKIIFENKNYFTVKTKNYNTSIAKADIIAGVTKIRRI